jgi:hypothetical protein
MKITKDRLSSRLQLWNEGFHIFEKQFLLWVGIGCEGFGRLADILGVDLEEILLVFFILGELVEGGFKLLECDVPGIFLQRGGFEEFLKVLEDSGLGLFLGISRCIEPNVL